MPAADALDRLGNAEHAVPDGDLADIVYRFRRDGMRGTLQLEVLDLRATA